MTSLCMRCSLRVFVDVFTNVCVHVHLWSLCTRVCKRFLSAEYIVASVVVWPCFAQRLIYCAADAIFYQTGSTIPQLTQPPLTLAFEMFILQSCLPVSFLLSWKVLCSFFRQGRDDRTMTTKNVSFWLAGRRLLKLRNRTPQTYLLPHQPKQVTIETIFLLCTMSPFNSHWWNRPKYEIIGLLNLKKRVTQIFFLSVLQKSGTSTKTQKSVFFV